MAGIVAKRTYIEMGFRSTKGIVAFRHYGDIAITQIGFVLINYN